MKQNQREIFNISIAEIKFFTEYQHVKTLDDLLSRRLGLTYWINSLDDKVEIITDFANALRVILNWNIHECHENIREYFNVLDKQFLFKTNRVNQINQ